jgi:hypothetical protein
MNEETLLALPDPQNKGELLERMAAGWGLIDEIVALQSEVQLTRPLGVDGWSIKDHLAHLMLWERGMVALLHKQPRYEAMGLTPELVAGGDYEAINDHLFRLHRDRPLKDVLAGWRDTHQEMVTALEGLADGDLFVSYTHYQPDETREGFEAPVMGWLAGNTYGHYAEHAGWIREKLTGR